MADLKFELVTPDRLVMSDDVYMVGGIDEVVAKAEKLAQEA